MSKEAANGAIASFALRSFAKEASRAVPAQASTLESRWVLRNGEFAPFFPEADDADQDTGDLAGGVDEDALDSDDLDTDRVTSDEGPPAHPAL